MSKRIEEIKRDLPGLRKHFGTDYGWPKDIDYLLRIADAAEQVDKVFHIRDKVVPPSDHKLFPSEKSSLIELSKILEANNG